ncbi:dUTP diphosphatase [Clostridium sp. JS66]|uniref:dUTP diphosphatase n=1 Tax=Clostridium sp. JS66 TaxID=3064705 RepID=UPI00298E3AD5|nr:dUTP diphosphatase [Clostridium sp. JS66]WPC41866.1 dUTP diphosphatase [Clostridium sp. JS66]
MNLEKLFHLQQNLNERIEKEHELDQTSLLSKKVLALQVELAELANETKCFKYWSSKSASNRNIVLEEFVDCLHFILSLGLEKSFENINNIAIKDSQYDIVAQFLNLYVDINDFFICSSKDNYITLFEDFLALGKSLDFNIEDIENAYLIKNSINHKRQDKGY